jgi:hypothetical protein
MFESVEREILDRVRQSKAILNILDELEPSDDESHPEIFKIQKGLLFVSLYSSVEFSLTAVVSSFLESIGNNPKKPMDYQRYLLCCILNAEFNSIRDSSKKTIWDKKSRLLDSLFSEESASIDASVFPSDGINISHKQLEDIWKFFHLPGQELPDGINPFLLNEIKDHRNAIAHGRMTASEVGARYTPSVLKSKESDIELVCFHILEAFRNCYKNNLYIMTGTA